MQAVGFEVLIVFSPIIILSAVAIYQNLPKIKETFQRIWRRDREDDEQRRRFEGGECSFCLEPKKYEVSATCGHSFCCRCLFEIYQRWNEQIQCPLCRRLVTTILRVFTDRQGTAEERTAAIQKIREYNNRFEDNRPFFRRIGEFPIVFKTMLKYILTFAFLLLFLRSTFFRRCMFFILFYLLLPIDLLPEGVFGLGGLIDDIVIAFFMLMFGLTGFGIFYVREH